MNLEMTYKQKLNHILKDILVNKVYYNYLYADTDGEYEENIKHTWRDVYSDDDDDDEIIHINNYQTNLNFQSLSFNNIIENTLFSSIPMKKTVSFEKKINVVLIPEITEHDPIRDVLWYTDEELKEFVQHEIELRKKEKALQENELQKMRSEEIRTIMLDW